MARSAHAFEGYQAALQQHADAIEDAPKSIQLVMKKSLARSWKKLADERLEDQNPTIPRGTKFWSLSKSERSAIDEMFQTPCSATPCDVAEIPR